MFLEKKIFFSLFLVRGNLVSKYKQPLILTGVDASTLEGLRASPRMGSIWHSEHGRWRGHDGTTCPWLPDTPSRPRKTDPPEERKKNIKSPLTLTG
jgi:hypothetical protein